jgi:antitoxin ParD1/3/4
MGKNTSVSLDDHFTAFIEGQVGQGRYGNASDVMRAGLRLLEEHETSLAMLRVAVAVGEQSGVSSRSVRDIWNAVRDEPRGP